MDAAVRQSINVFGILLHMLLRAQQREILSAEAGDRSFGNFSEESLFVR